MTLHWMSSNQFNLNCLRYTPSGGSISTSSDLNCDSKRNSGTCERKDLSIYIDLSPSSEANSGADKTDNAYELKASSMEPTAMGPQNGLSPSCGGLSIQEELQSNGFTPHMGRLSIGEKGGRAFEPTHGGEGNSSKDLNSVERLPADLKAVAKQSVGQQSKGGHVQGSMSLKQAARQSHHKTDQKQLGKRGGAELERETSQQKRVKPMTAGKVVPVVKYETAGSRSLPAAYAIDDKTTSTRKVEASHENEVEALATQGVNDVAEPAMLVKAQPKPRARDITKQEAAFEFQQCVSLLHKYGVLNTKEYYLCQVFPSCAPHPGFVGDKLQPKRCKICRVLEDSNNTVICDACQESFHLTCCLPRLNPKHFDREDDWYCSSCRKQKRRMGRFCDSGRADGSGDSAGTSFISKVKVGSAYQANVSLWTGKVDDSSTRGLFGAEEPLSEEAKEKEKDFLLKDFELKAGAWRRQLANNAGTPENWLRCHGVLVKAFKDHEGHKHSEILCGKWRRAPLNMQQFDRWECFCTIEWDPCHADCAIPQELPTEEILRRMQGSQDLQPSEVLEKEA